MPPISHLLMLIAAFFGADLSAAWVDIDHARKDLDVDLVAEYCFGFDVEAFEFHNDYEEDWYAWERCMLSYTDYGLADVDSARRIGRSEAEELVAEIWEDYTPWMREALTETLYFHDDEDRYRIVLADDWAPPLPRINTGAHKVEEHCSGDDLFGACAVLPSLTFVLHEHIGQTSIWHDPNDVEVYETWFGTVQHKTRGRIVTPKRNRYNVLHETAHLINNYRYHLWDDETPTTSRHLEYYRTGGHGIEFRCLLLDLYTNYGDEFVTEIDQWWEASYDELHRLCQIIAPSYARPSAPADS
jgi:hypothetical protein